MLVALEAQGCGTSASARGLGASYVQVWVGACVCTSWPQLLAAYASLDQRGLHSQKHCRNKRQKTQASLHAVSLVILAMLYTDISRLFAAGVHSALSRAHWLQLELVFCGWRKVAAVAKQQQQQQQQGPADSAGTGLDQQQEAPADKAMLSASSSITSSAAEAGNGGCSDTEDCVTEEEEPMVHVSLADYPVVHPWRPLLQRKAVLAPQGLRRLTGLRLGRAVKDLRELEGGFVAKDHDR